MNIKENDVLGIVMTNWNRLDITRQSLDSMIVNTTLPHRICVVDNYSTDDFDNVNGVEIRRSKSNPTTSEYLNRLKDEHKIHHVLLNTENYGLGFARNVGVDILNSSVNWKFKDDIQFILVADSDLLYPPNWQKILYGIWNRYHESENLGAIMLSHCPEHYATKYFQDSDNRLLMIKNPCAGNGIFMPMDIFYKVGKFPTDILIGNEDWKLCEMLSHFKYNILNCEYLLTHLGKGHSLWLGPEK